MINIINRLWLKLVPGEIIKVKWPDPNDKYILDPYHHYSLYLESNVGKQMIDWDWVLLDNTWMECDLITIKLRRRNPHMASILILLWG